MARFTSTRTYLSRGSAVNSRYELECTDCSFQATVVGEFDEVFEDIEAHREECSAGPTEHFVNVHRVIESEQT